MSGTGRNSSSLWANLHVLPYMHRPRLKNLHNSVLCCALAGGPTLSRGRPPKLGACCEPPAVAPPDRTRPQSLRRRPISADAAAKVANLGPTSRDLDDFRPKLGRIQPGFDKGRRTATHVEQHSEPLLDPTSTPDQLICCFEEKETHHKIMRVGACRKKAGDPRQGLFKTWADLRRGGHHTQRSPDQPRVDLRSTTDRAKIDPQVAPRSVLSRPRPTSTADRPRINPGPT